jgi:hypothetical protein
LNAFLNNEMVFGLLLQHTIIEPPDDVNRIRKGNENHGPGSPGRNPTGRDRPAGNPRISLKTKFILDLIDQSTISLWCGSAVAPAVLSRHPNDGPDFFKG